MSIDKILLFFPVNFRKYAFPKSIMQPVIAIALKTINKPPGSSDSGGGTDGPDKEEDDR